MKYNKKTELIVDTVFNWCCVYLGTPLKTYPKIKIIEDKRYKNIFGEYENKEITIFINSCHSRKDIINTIIHEYTHFLQMPRKNDIDKYHKLLNYYNYNSHPYEIEADEYADIYRDSCIKFLRKNKIIK